MSLYVLFIFIILSYVISMCAKYCLVKRIIYVYERVESCIGNFNSCVTILSLHFNVGKYFTEKHYLYIISVYTIHMRINQNLKTS